MAATRGMRRSWIPSSPHMPGASGTAVPALALVNTVSVCAPVTGRDRYRHPIRRLPFRTERMGITPSPSWSPDLSATVVAGKGYVLEYDAEVGVGAGHAAASRDLGGPWCR